MLAMAGDLWPLTSNPRRDAKPSKAHPSNPNTSSIYDSLLNLNDTGLRWQGSHAKPGEMMPKLNIRRGIFTHDITARKADKLAPEGNFSRNPRAELRHLLG